MKSNYKVTKRKNTINILNGTKANDLYKAIISNENLVQVGIEEFLIMHRNDNVAATLACEAAKNSNSGFLETLTNCGVDVTIPDQQGFNAYYYMKMNGNGHDIELAGENSQ